MALFNFSCPHCNQLVQGDEQWSGQQIQCPACNGGIIVPQNAAATPPPPLAPTPAPAPPQKPGSKLKVTAMPHAPAPPPPPQAPPAARVNYAAARPKKSNDKGKWVKMSIVLVVCCVGGFFLFSYLSKWQSQVNNSKDDSGGGGMAGEAGHISELNNVLDITEPDHMGMTSKEAAAEARRAKKEKAKFEAEMKQLQANAPNEGGGVSPEQGNAVANASAEMAKMPLASGVWSLDLDTAATIPEGRANGMISGTNFVVDTAVLVKVGLTQVLALRQGTNTASDREMFVRFQLNAGEELAGHTFSISQEMKGKGVPQVTKSWKTNPRYAPTKKAFATGYAMKLEFGQPTPDGIFPGKISVSLPDPEESYVVGSFKAAFVTPVSN